MKNSVFTMRLAPALAAQVNREAIRRGMTRTSWAAHLARVCDSSVDCREEGGDAVAPANRYDAFRIPSCGPAVSSVGRQVRGREEPGQEAAQGRQGFPVDGRSSGAADEACEKADEAPAAGIPERTQPQRDAK